MAPSQLLPVLATPKTQTKCSGGTPPAVASPSPAPRRALSREISRSLEASCSRRRSCGPPETSPRIIPTSNLRYALTSLATSNTMRCCKLGIRYLPRVRARISALFGLRSHPLYYPVWFEPTARDPRRRDYTALFLRSRRDGT